MLEGLTRRPRAAETMSWSPTHLPVELVASNVEKRPKPTSASAHPSRFAHRYFCTTWTSVPATNAKGEMTSASGRVWTLERRGRE